MMKYVCDFCKVFVLDTEKGDKNAGISPGTSLEEVPEGYRCPVCGQPSSYLKEITDDEFEEKLPGYEKMFPEEQEKESDDIVSYRNKARELLAGTCAVNKVCDGNPDRLCMGQKYDRPIGFGGAGQGRTFDANFKALEKYRFRMRVVKKYAEPEFTTEFMGQKMRIPVFVSSVSGVRISMNDVINEKDFQKRMIEGASLFGTVGMSGNTVDYPDHPGVELIGHNKGIGIPVFKPQAMDTLLKLIKRAEKTGCTAIGVDLDGFGSQNWAYRGKPVYRKSREDLQRIVQSTSLPVMFKGIMAIEDAKEAYQAGAKAIVISNHGGRVLDYGQGVAEVLPGIAKELKGKIRIIADGAVRTGFDVLKLLALGSDYVSIGRPMARMALSGGTDGIKQYLEYVEKDLRLAMLMTGCDTLKEIDESILVHER